MFSSFYSSSSGDESETILVMKRDLLFSDSARYLVMDIIGEGGYGQVVKCLNLITGKTIAVKILKDGESESILWEMEMLEAIRSLDTEKKNIVKFIEDFKCHDYSCLAFEMLDKSLWDLIEKEGKPLSLNEIRPVTQQLMVAFEALKGLGIMHLDLKPDNVMLVNHKDQPFRIKLIDFGLAHPVGVLETGTEMQVLAYRALEVMLGLPLSEAVDIWGVGCIMAYMYFGDHLFPFDCEYNWMRTLLQLLGQPEEHQLNDAMYTWKYFSRDHGSTTQSWRLKTRGEYEDATGVRAKDLMTFFGFTENLEDVVEGWSEKQDVIEYEDRMAFLSLLKACLHVDPARRICSGEALKHRFITMVHLVNEVGTSSYVDAALQLMTVSYLHQSVHTESSSEDEDSYSESDFMGHIYNCSNSGSKTEEDYSAGEEAVADSSSGADGDIEISSNKYSDDFYDTDVPSHESSTRSSVAMNVCGGVRDTDTSSKEDSVTVAAFREDDTNTDCLLVASNTNDRGSSDIGPTDGAAASMSSKDTAAAAIRPTNADHDKTRPDGGQRRTIFQRTCKFFRRVKKRVVSVFRGHKN